MACVFKTLLVLRPGGWTVEELGLELGSKLWSEFVLIVILSLKGYIYQGLLYGIL
jgi:hypothetical protein